MKKLIFDAVIITVFIFSIILLVMIGLEVYDDYNFSQQMQMELS